MTRVSLVLWAGMTAVLGLVSSVETTLAAEIKVLASVALTSALNTLTPAYELIIAHKPLWTQRMGWASVRGWGRLIESSGLRLRRR
jgi:hypothetical protein